MAVGTAEYDLNNYCHDCQELLYAGNRNRTKFGRNYYGYLCNGCVRGPLKDEEDEEDIFVLSDDENEGWLGGFTNQKEAAKNCAKEQSERLKEPAANESSKTILYTLH